MRAHLDDTHGENDSLYFPVCGINPFFLPDGDTLIIPIVCIYAYLPKQYAKALLIHDLDHVRRTFRNHDVTGCASIHHTIPHVSIRGYV